jgi:hypothetical protein
MMTVFHPIARAWRTGLLVALSAVAGLVSAADDISFNRDVRPVLSDNCFACHGPDAGFRKGDLRLDVRDDAIAAGAIVPGKPAESSLVERISATDPDVVMPPPEAHKKLTAAQKDLLVRWIAAGAVYERHWAYEPPVKEAVPDGSHPIDHLVRRRLASIRVEPSPEADRRTLIRRLSFDLTGLPPHPDEVDAFVADTRPDAYDVLVDRLLASPHFGERMATGWLDVVRFADTIGYHSDNPRHVWPYRDYVITSFNANKPFDRFTIEQLAGDLLPDATDETRVASCFNRLLLTTEEGGAQAKDYEARMLNDRVRAVGAVWLGQTTGCSACHDHKFDPITMRDFYALAGFFADIDEPAIGRRGIGMLLATPEEKATLAELDAAVADARTKQQEIVAREAAAREAAAREAAAREAATSEANAPAGGDAPSAGDPKKAEPSPEARAARDAVAAAEKRRKSFHDRLTTCLVTSAKPQPTVVRILPRGNWMDESGEVVKPAFPGYLPAPVIEGREPTRLDLARWLVSREHPLTARVVMNRLWQQFFGMGLSRVLDDLGAQGEPPRHPQVLDWLACEFMDSGWDVKHMVRTIVTSATYRQSSVASAARVAADPGNREFARQSAFRLDAEFVRDATLATSGLLVRTVGGPSVKPYQPDGYWENLNFPTREYVADTGANQYRRGLYTWWQRTFLHPSLLAFDAPSREECCAERTRSNIPQQALALLNDPTYVEAARAFAVRIMTESRGGPEERVAWAWRQALGRLPRVEEIETIIRHHRVQLAAYQADRSAAEALLSVGLAPAPADLDRAELAAWTHVARVILNLHETITRP